MKNHTIPSMKRFILGMIALITCLHLLAESTFGQSITTYAGGQLPIDGAPANTQPIEQPSYVISDRAGGVYFTSYGNPYQRVFRIYADGTITTIAGALSGFSGDGGPARSAQLSTPQGLALDASGNLYIADTQNSRIRKVTPAGVISTFAGTGQFGYAGDGGPATLARLNSPSDVAVDGGGNVFVADTSNSRIRKITPAGTISTVAGTAQQGGAGDGGPAASAQLYRPVGIAIDGSGNIFIAEGGAAFHRVRKINPAGVISTFAGSGISGFAGDGGPATSARVTFPRALAVDASGALFIADSGNHRIRKVTAEGVISTVAGNGLSQFNEGDSVATSAALNYPAGIAVDASGTLFIADSGNSRIRRVTVNGNIATLAGTGGQGGIGDGGSATLATFNRPNGIAVDNAGNLFIADTGNSRVRKVTPGGLISPFAGNGTYGTGGDGGSATSAQLESPGGVAVDAAGNVFITDCNRLRKVGAGGIIEKVSSRSWSFCDYYYYYYYYYDYVVGTGGGIAVDAGGNLFVADTFNNRVYKVSPDGTATAVAGSGSFDFRAPLGDGGPALSASLRSPWAVAIDTAGNLYISDQDNQRIRKVTPEGIISTVAGIGVSGFIGDGGPATLARLNAPAGIAVDAAGNLFIADQFNNRVRKVAPSGIISTVAGTGVAGFSGDGGEATSARLDSPTNVAVDAAGNLFIADTNNFRIRRVGFTLTVPTLLRVSQTFGAPGSTVTVSLDGTSFSNPLTIDAGVGVTVSNVNVVSDVRATATFTIALNAAVGARNVTASTALGTSNSIAFTVVPPFPDLSITSSHGLLGVGFNATYVVGITNVGSAATTGTMTVTDFLPLGLTFVSGSGNGWSCSSAEQKVTCVKSDLLAAGESTSLDLTVAVGASAPPGLIPLLKVASDGDVASANNAAADPTTVAIPLASLRFTPQTLVAGEQATVEVTLPAPFPFDVTGRLEIGFSSSAVNPADDPAIQLAGGGRTVAFTIPANTLQARFETSPQAGPVGFQPGTVAGIMSFSGMLQTGNVQTAFTAQATIPRLPPRIHSAQKQSVDAAGFVLVLNLSSTLREVTRLSVGFDTTQAVRIHCGAVASCSASGNGFSLDVKSMFDTWFAGDALYGSTSTLQVPLSIGGGLRGHIVITLLNRLGVSNSMSVELP